MRKRILIFVTAMVVLAQTFSTAQQSQKPMTNDDVITMVKNKMPETVVVSAIQARSSNIQYLHDRLIRLQKSGVTENELNAMITASNKGAATDSLPKPSVCIDARRVRRRSSLQIAHARALRHKWWRGANCL